MTERLSRTQIDLQRLTGRRGINRDGKALTWADLDSIMAEIAARSKVSEGKYTAAIGAGEGGAGTIDVGDIISPNLGAPTGLAITSSVDADAGISYIYFDWDDVVDATGYELGIKLNSGGEFPIYIPRSNFQNSVIAGTTIEARVRAINALGVPGTWSAYENHVAAMDDVPPPVPGNVTIEPAFNGFWFKWDKSTAADISRYEVYEGVSATPAPDALTTPTFVSASPLFFRGAVGNAVTRHYWIRAVDYSENASDWSLPVTSTTLHISEADLGDNIIVARHLTAGELITLSAQIKDAIISDAKIANLSAAKLIAGSAIANSVTVNGQAIGTIQQNANDPAARINAATTKIEPGKITISGSTDLYDWTATGNRTQIDGGRIYTNSIDASSINTTDLAADSGFITNLTSTGSSFMNQLIVRTANIETAAITNAKIGNAAVDTLKIAGNAVTVPAVVVGPGNVGSGTTSWQNAAVAGITLNESGSVLVMWNFQQGYSSEVQWGVRILRNGSPILSRTGMAFGNDYPSGAVLQNLSGGVNYTFTLQWAGQNSNINAVGTLILLGVQR